MLTRLLTEFIGTFFLLLIIALAVASAGNMAPLAIGVGLMVLVYMGGHISGAVYNPAVNLSLLAAGKMTAGRALAYTAVQVAGGALGAVVGRGMTLQPLFPSPPTDVAGDYAVISAMTAEGLFTGLLALVILNVAKHPKLPGNQFYGAAIGGAVLAGAYTAGRISGGAFNPAVTLGFAAGQMSAHDPVPTSWLWQAIASQLVGAVVAAVIFRMQEKVGPE